MRVADLEMELQQTTTKNQQMIDQLRNALDDQIETNNQLEKEVLDLKVKNSQQEEDYEEVGISNTWLAKCLVNWCSAR